MRPAAHDDAEDREASDDRATPGEGGKPAERIDRGHRSHTQSRRNGRRRGRDRSRMPFGSLPGCRDRDEVFSRILKQSIWSDVYNKNPPSTFPRPRRRGSRSMRTRTRAQANDVPPVTSHQSLPPTHHYDMDKHNPLVLYTPQNRANEPSGNLGEFCGFISGSFSSELAAENRANEPSGNLDKICRLSFHDLHVSSALLRSGANEPNGNLGRLCRSAENTPRRRQAVAVVSRANEPNGNLGKVCGLFGSSCRIRLAGAKRRNKAISDIANRWAHPSCIHRRAVMTGVAARRTARGLVGRLQGTARVLSDPGGSGRSNTTPLNLLLVALHGLMACVKSSNDDGRHCLASRNPGKQGISEGGIARACKILVRI